MKLFLSYGHLETAITKLIKSNLTTVGYDDWRAKIVRGILDTQGEIGCLSKHSVRDSEVCLNEFSILVRYRYGNIITIFLDKESDVKVPSSVSYIQWIDRSIWKKKCFI